MGCASFIQRGGAAFYMDIQDCNESGSEPLEEAEIQNIGVAGF